MAWSVTFYDRKVEKELLELPPGILAAFLRIVVLITVVKKGDRIPRRHMDTARKRMKEMQDGR